MRMVPSPCPRIWDFAAVSAMPFSSGGREAILGAISDRDNPMRSALCAAVVLALLVAAGGAPAQTTDLLLVLAADVSRSVDEGEFDLQRKGYAAAVTDPRVLAAIRGGTNGAIAVCFVEWSGAGGHNVASDR